jgi:hypothetical protein
MTSKELRLSALLLDLAADEYANHGCNDLSGEMLALITDEMDLELHKWNGDPEEHQPGSPCNADFCWMNFMAERLRAKADEMDKLVP